MTPERLLAERRLESLCSNALAPLVGCELNQTTLERARHVCGDILRQEIASGTLPADDPPLIEVASDNEGIVFTVAWAAESLPPPPSAPALPLPLPALTPAPEADAALLSMIEGERFATRLRMVRKARGLTQQQLAERSGVEASSISRWENGESVATDPKVEAVAAVLQVPPRVLDPNYRPRDRRGQVWSPPVSSPPPEGAREIAFARAQRKQHEEIVGLLRVLKTETKLLVSASESIDRFLREMLPEILSAVRGFSALISLEKHFRTTLIPLMELLVELRERVSPPASVPASSAPPEERSPKPEPEPEAVPSSEETF